MTFREWLQKYETHNTPRGDLARDVKQDRSFPDYTSLEQYRNYMYKVGACRGAVKTLESAWTSYRRDSYRRTA